MSEIDKPNTKPLTVGETYEVRDVLDKIESQTESNKQNPDSDKQYSARCFKAAYYSAGILILLATGTFIAFFCYLPEFIHAKNMYDGNVFVRDAICIQNSTNKLIVLIPEYIRMTPEVTGSISYEMYIADIGEEFACIWNPCNSASSYVNLNTGEHTECVWYSGKNGQYRTSYETPSPVYLDLYTEYYVNYIIVFTVLGVLVPVFVVSLIFLNKIPAPVKDSLHSSL